MPIIRKELKSDPVMARLAAYSTAEFRPLVAVGFVGAIVVAVFMTFLAHGIAVWAAAVVGISIAAFGLYKLRKERALLSHYKTAVATVSNWSRAEMADGGYSYAVRYRFLGPDGKVYLGESGATDRALPQEGATIPVLYTPEDPSKNRTLATFLFYQFSYTGTE
jgi:hypothetical protein